MMLHMRLETHRDQEETNRQMTQLEDYLNDGWSLKNSISLSGAGGITAVCPSGGGGGVETMQFAEWAAVLVLERT
jgi:hypothetical protein